MTALYHLTHRFSIEAVNVGDVRAEGAPAIVDALRAILTRSNSFSHVGDRRLRIHTWRGVPAKHVDVLLDDGPSREGQIVASRHSQTGEIMWERPWLLCCDIGRKQGRYDGAERWRVTFRDLSPSTEPPPSGRLTIEEHHDGELALIALWKGGAWAQSFPQLRYELDERTEIRGVLVRQAQMYFRHLWPSQADEVQALANEWSLLPDVRAIADINALNRDASQALYQLSTQLGWKKLTLRQREQLGLGAESQQWQREERVQALRLQAGLGTPAGVGRYTLDAANGATLHLPVGTCPQCFELATDCECQA